MILLYNLFPDTKNIPIKIVSDWIMQQAIPWTDIIFLLNAQLSLDQSFCSILIPHFFYLTLQLILPLPNEPNITEHFTKLLLHIEKDTRPI